MYGMKDLFRLDGAPLRRLAASGLAKKCADARALVLTYDDGPGGLTTSHILDCLVSKRAHATFFLLGFRSEGLESVVNRMKAEGNEIACHTYQHLHAWKAPRREIIADIARGYESLARWVSPDGLFRPPYGKMTWKTWSYLRDIRRAPIGWWTIDSGDTAQDIPDPSSVVNRVRRARGGVVLMHDFDRETNDANDRRQFVLETTDRLLRLAKSESLNVMTLGHLLEIGNGSKV